MPNQPDEKLTVSMPFDDKVWLANYARLRRMTMSAVVLTLIHGLRDAQNAPPVPAELEPPAGVPEDQPTQE